MTHVSCRDIPGNQPCTLERALGPDPVDPFVKQGNNSGTTFRHGCFIRLCLSDFWLLIGQSFRGDDVEIGGTMRLKPDGGKPRWFTNGEARVPRGITR
jgi:hypothetical protein